MCDLPHTLKLFESNKGGFFLHVSNVLGMCRGVCMQSQASYAEACLCWHIRSFFMFQSFQKFFGSYSFMLFKNLLLYIWL